MKSIYELVSKLARHGVSIELNGNSLKLVRPPSLPSWEGAPEEVKALVRELKARKPEVIKYLTQWDEPAALGQFRAALNRIRRQFPENCITWAKDNRPELWQAVLDAQEEFDQAFHGQDMAGCRRAAAGYERAFDELISTYNQQRPLSTEEAIKAFGCGRVWDLPPHKAAQLDAVFAKEGVR